MDTWLLKWCSKRGDHFSHFLQFSLYYAPCSPVKSQPKFTAAQTFYSFLFYFIKVQIVERAEGKQDKRGWKQREKERLKCRRTRDPRCAHLLPWQRNMWTSVTVKERRFAMYAGMALNTLSVHVNACAEVRRRENRAPSLSLLLNHVAQSFPKKRFGPSNNMRSAANLNTSWFGSCTEVFYYFSLNKLSWNKEIVYSVVKVSNELFCNPNI